MSARLLLFPGMGADARMYQPLGRLLPGLIVPSWPQPVGGRTMREAAQVWVAGREVRAGDVIGGSSFGGMFALEVARLVAVGGVILLGSTRTPAALPLAARALAPWSRLVPDRVLTMRGPLNPLVAWKFGVRQRRQRALFTAMQQAADPALIRWSCQALAAWPGVPEPGCPVLHVHGADDRVIPAAGAAPDHVVPGAGHVLALTHPQPVAALIQAFLAQLDGRAPAAALLAASVPHLHPDPQT